MIPPFLRIGCGKLTNKGASSWLTAVPLVDQGLLLNKEFRDSLRLRYNMPLSDLPDNERFNLRSAVTSPKARLDFKAGGFWSRGVTAFFDVRITHVTSVTREKQHPQSLWSRRRRKSGNTNRGCWTLKWDLSLP